MSCSVQVKELIDIDMLICHNCSVHVKELDVTMVSMLALAAQMLVHLYTSAPNHLL